MDTIHFIVCPVYIFRANARFTPIIEPFAPCPYTVLRFIFTPIITSTDEQSKILTAAKQRRFFTVIRIKMITLIKTMFFLLNLSTYPATVWLLPLQGIPTAKKFILPNFYL